MEYSVGSVTGRLRPCQVQYWCEATMFFSQSCMTCAGHNIQPNRPLGQDSRCFFTRLDGFCAPAPSHARESTEQLQRRLSQNCAVGGVPRRLAPTLVFAWSSCLGRGDSQRDLVATGGGSIGYRRVAARDPDFIQQTPRVAWIEQLRTAA